MNATGKILLFRGGDPISYLVKWQTRSIYSHAALLIPGTQSCVESYPGAGVRIRKLGPKDYERIDMYDVKGLDPDGWTKALDYARSQIGKGYDWLSVVRFLDKIPASENHRWFCSELVFKAIKVGGVELLHRINSAEVAPGHIGISPLLMPVSEEPETVIV